MSNDIDTDEVSAKYRAKAIRADTKQLLIARLAGSEQAADLTRPPNCGGYGRVRHFRTLSTSNWPSNPLPIVPACKALGVPVAAEMSAQAFQNAVCNWRCWYCYVPFNLLAGDESRAGWFTADELVARYEIETDKPLIVDLTGGQPDLVPEWVPWTMDALEERGLKDAVYLWSDDNLSNDYFWRFLSPEGIEKIKKWRNYGRVCCFKGFDAASFAFNTGAAEDLFDRQFALFEQLTTLNIDLYAYVTLTAASAMGIEDSVRRFLDRLQRIDPKLPLRTVPLEVSVFSPVRRRLDTERTASLSHQYKAVEIFRREIEARFPVAEREASIADIKLQCRDAVAYTGRSRS